MHTSEDYSNDFESASVSESIPEEFTETKKSDITLSYQYSDDFEDSIPSRPTSSVRFSEDLEQVEIIPKSPLQRQYSSYSEDFESGTDDEYTDVTDDSQSRLPATESYTNYSSDTFEPTTTGDKTLQYSESFESYATTFNEQSSEDGSSDQTFDSVIQSPRKSQTFDRMSSYTSDRSTVPGDESDSSYTIGFTTTETENTEILGEAHRATEDFITKKLQLLKNRTSVGVHKPNRRYPQPTLDPGDRRSMKSFCTRKLELLKKKKTGALDGEELSKSNRIGESYKERVTGLSDKTIVEGSGITSSAVTHLRLKNTMSKINKMATMPVHEPKTCKQCMEKMAALEEEHFIRRKYAIASEKIIDHRIENEIIKLNDPTLLFGEILKDLPRLSDDPKVIYEKLMAPLKDSGKRIPHVDVRNLPKATDEEYNLFWLDYFERLKHCSWFPKDNPKTETD